MAIQNSANLSNLPFVIGTEKAYTKDAEVVVQDAGRGTTAMAIYTLMIQDPATEKWNSFTDETATDGTELPQGILMKALTAAEIVAGDVVDVPILIKGTVDEQQLVIENSKTLATEITSQQLTVERYLGGAGIYVRDTTAIDGFEN